MLFLCFLYKNDFHFLCLYSSASDVKKKNYAKRSPRKIGHFFLAFFVIFAHDRLNEERLTLSEHHPFYSPEPPFLLVTWGRQHFNTSSTGDENRVQHAPSNLVSRVPGGCSILCSTVLIDKSSCRIERFSIFSDPCITLSTVKLFY